MRAFKKNLLCGKRLTWINLGEGKNGEEWGKKKLGSKLLCLVGIRKYLIFYLKEIESH